MSRAAMEERYITMFGAVPPNIVERLRVAEATGRMPAIEALEAFRHVFLEENALGERVQRLVHFGMTLAHPDVEVISSHARSAVRAGAGLPDLVGVCETAAVVLGMPAYTRGIHAVAGLLGDDVDGGPHI